MIFIYLKYAFRITAIMLNRIKSYWFFAFLGIPQCLQFFLNRRLIPSTEAPSVKKLSLHQGQMSFDRKNKVLKSISNKHMIIKSSVITETLKLKKTMIWKILSKETGMPKSVPITKYFLIFKRVIYYWYIKKPKF